MIEAIKNRRSVRKYKNEPSRENTVAGKAEKTKEKEVESKRQIIMRLDTRLLQPFTSWSNSL